MRGDKAENDRCSGRRISIFFGGVGGSVFSFRFSQVNECCNYARIPQGKK